ARLKSCPPAPSDFHSQWRAAGSWRLRGEIGRLAAAGSLSESQNCAFRAICSPQSVHSYRRASMGSNREALSAGYQPAPTPIAPANEKAIPMAEVDTSVGQPSEREMTWELKTPMPIPRAPPKTARTTASVRNWN